MRARDSLSVDERVYARGRERDSLGCFFVTAAAGTAWSACVRATRRPHLPSARDGLQSARAPVPVALGFAQSHAPESHARSGRGEDGQRENAAERRAMAIAWRGCFLSRAVACQGISW